MESQDSTIPQFCTDGYLSEGLYLAYVSIWFIVSAAQTIDPSTSALDRAGSNSWRATFVD